MTPDRDSNELEWKPLTEIAQKWLDAARSEFGDQAKSASFQELIDALPDHNQTMIDCIEETSPGLDCAITELMSEETEYAEIAWVAVVNHIFELAQRKHEEGP